MALNFHPLELPVLAVDDHLPAVVSDELLADAMRRRFGTPPTWSPEIAIERQLSGRSPVHASVLVALVQREEGLSVLLTQRTDHLTDHPGQVSFPGGRAEPEDADAVATALREAEEEIGLLPAYVDVWQLPTYTTATGSSCHRWSGVVHADFSLRIDPFEGPRCSRCRCLPDEPANHRWHAIEVAGKKREFLSMPWTGVDALGQPRIYFVWGSPRPCCETSIAFWRRSAAWRHDPPLSSRHMSFFAVLFALLIEQLNPCRVAISCMARSRAGCAGPSEFRCRTRSPRLVVWGRRRWCRPARVGIFLAIAHFNVLVALAGGTWPCSTSQGFRQFSHYFTDIRDALQRGDETTARTLLAEWRHLDASELPRTELLRHIIEHSLLAAHRHVFGVFFWFVVLSTFGFGPAGAVLYRMAEFASRYWAFKSRVVGVPSNERLLALSQRLFSLTITAGALTASVCVGGQLRRAISCWRRDAGCGIRQRGIILAAARLPGAFTGRQCRAGVHTERSKPSQRIAAEPSRGGSPPVHCATRSPAQLVALCGARVLWMRSALLSLQPYR